MIDQRGDLVEREREVAKLGQVIDAALAGRGTTLVLAGPAGIGKTRLLRVAAERAAAEGFAVCTARGGVLEIDHPFGIVRQLLGALPSAPLPAGGERRAGPPGDTAFRTFDAVYQSIAAQAAACRALLVSVDDAQWSDVPSLRFLHYLAVRVDRLPVAVVIAARPAETAADPGALPTLAGDNRTLVLDLAPLTSAGVASVLSGRLPGPVSPEFVTACAGASGGNPFLISELVHMIGTEDIAPVPANAPRVRELTPPAVGRSVLARLGRQSGPARQIAQALAVLGGTAEVRIVAALCGLTPAAAAAAADDLIAARVLAPSRKLEFLHPLVRAAVYTDLPLHRRRAQHAVAARVLAEHGLDRDDVAAQLLLTDPSGDPWVCGQLTAAGQRALDQATPDVALPYLRRALAEPPGPRSLCALLTMLGEAESRCGDDDAAVRLLRRALDVATGTAARTRIVRWLGHALRQLGRAAEAVAAITAVVDGMPECDREFGLRLIAELRLADFYCPPATHARWSPRFAVPRRVPATPGERLALLGHALDECFAGTAGEAGRLTQLALGSGALVAEEGPDAPMVHLAISLLVYTDRLDLAERTATDVLHEAERRGLLLAAAVLRSLRAGARLRKGALAGAELDARAGLDAYRYGLRFRPSPAAAFLAEVLVEQGDTAAATAILSAEDAGGTLPEMLTTNLLQHARGHLHATTGNLVAALADYRECQRREIAWGLNTPALTPTGSSIALTLAGLGSHDDARAEAATALAKARSFGAPGALGAALVAAGTITASPEPVREAVAILERSQAHLEHIRALVALGDVMLRTGRTADARDALRSALRQARRHGATALAAQAYTQLTATGANQRRIVRGGRGALTPAERRVGALAARGASNQQIADALVVSIRTVESHLAHIYQKLDITSRRQLGARLQPEPALQE